MKKKPDAWDLYRAMFKDGDEVIVIDDFDDITWGRIYAHEDCAELKNPNKKNEKICWDDIRFIAHDGFPAKILSGADGSKTIENIDTKNIQKAIRELYVDAIKIEKIEESRSSFRVGDPFDIENVRATLMNPGNTYNEDLNNWQYEEVLLFSHPNGSSGMLWDLSTIFMFEKAA